MSLQIALDDPDTKDSNYKTAITLPKPKMKF